MTDYKAKISHNKYFRTAVASSWEHHFYQRSFFLSIHFETRVKSKQNYFPNCPFFSKTSGKGQNAFGSYKCIIFPQFHHQIKTKLHPGKWKLILPWGIGKFSWGDAPSQRNTRSEVIISKSLLNDTFSIWRHLLLLPIFFQWFFFCPLELLRIYVPRNFCCALLPIRRKKPIWWKNTKDTTSSIATCSIIFKLMFRKM